MWRVLICCVEQWSPRVRASWTILNIYDENFHYIREVWNLQPDVSRMLSNLHLSLPEGYVDIFCGCLYYAQVSIVLNSTDPGAALVWWQYDGCEALWSFQFGFQAIETHCLLVCGDCWVLVSVLAGQGSGSIVKCSKELGRRLRQECQFQLQVETETSELVSSWNSREFQMIPDDSRIPDCWLSIGK